MAVAEIEKIQIITHQNYKKKLLELLYDTGFVEIISPSLEENEPITKKAVDNDNIEYKLAKIQFTLEFLTPYFFEKKSLLEKINNEKRKISIKEIEKIENEFDYKKITDIAEEYNQSLNHLKSLKIKLEEEKRILIPWSNLKFITSDGLETNYTKIFLGTIKKQNYELFIEDVHKKFSEIEIVNISEEKEEVNLLIIAAKKYEKELLSVLTEKEFNTTELPAIKILPHERIEEINKEIVNIEKKILKINKQAEELSKEIIENLKIIHDHLTWQLHKEQIQDKFSFTEKTFAINGWMKKSELPNLKDKIKEITEKAEIISLKINEEEKIPIIMENNKFIEPLEFVTNIYSFPKYTEVDPTPFLAGFFIIFFGLCLTDAGYGLALAVCTFLALKFLNLSTGLTKLLKVLFYGSIITFIAGGLTGGWFGIVLEELPASLGWFAKPLIAIKAIDPVKEPITMLVISIILGYIHLLFGNAINLWWKIKHGKTKEGLIESGVWMLFLLSVGLWIVSSQDIFLANLSQVSLYLVYLSLALIVLTQGKGKNIFAKILGGLAELYFGLSGYISDILSYARLLALGLATGIIGMVINIVGALVNDMIPYVGWFFMIIILIGGHIFNLVISLVGAFIHSGRLQYVEFFKRFFDGGGKEFAPFVRESKYINLIKNN